MIFCLPSSYQVWMMNWLISDFFITLYVLFPDRRMNKHDGQMEMGFFFSFWNRVFVALAGLELLSTKVDHSLSISQFCWDWRHASLNLVYVVLGIKPKTPCTSANALPTELQPQPKAGTLKMFKLYIFIHFCISTTVLSPLSLLSPSPPLPPSIPQRG